MAKEWGFKVERIVFGQEEKDKRAVAVPKRVESKKIADQLELISSFESLCW